MAELIITLADGRTTRHRLGSQPEVIGREATCDIPLDDPSASRQHARFTPTTRGYLIEDLGSKNGTLVNDVPCTSKILRDGDQVQVGASVAIYREGALSSPGSVVVAEDDVTTSHGTRFVTADRRLLLSQQRLQMIYELSERLTTLQSQDQLLETVMDICFDTLSFERGAVGVRRRQSRVLDWPVVRNLQGAEGEITVSRTLLSRALDYGERAIFTEEGIGSTDPTVSMVQQGIRSAMCVPLIHKEETLGVLYGDSVNRPTSYTKEDIDFLAGIAQQVSIGLINARLLEDQQQMIRLNHDIDLARTIQRGLFPTELPNRAGLTMAALNDPGQRVSGDYYDVIELPDGRVWCLMADVTGEGVAAALLMANLQAAVRVTIEETDDPGRLLGRWNRLIWRNTDPSKFITAVLALIDPEHHTICVASAGHFLPIVRSSAQPALAALDGEAGYPLGIVEDADYPAIEADLGAAPFLFFCYTDGVVEAMNGDGDMFGADRLHEVLAAQNELNPHTAVKQVRKRVTGFVGDARQSDDITMLAARIG